MMAIEAEGLRKTFGKVQALRGVDLAVPEGSVCALLGPDGAGKTTAVRVLATLTRPHGGTARVARHDVVREPGGSASRSAWRASTRASTTTSPVGRTCSSSGSCTTWAGAARRRGPLNC